METTLILNKRISPPEGLEGPNSLRGYFLDLEVTEATLIPKEIFVFQRLPETAFGTNYVDTFYDLASVPNLYNLPIDSPAENSGFYRSKKASLCFESRAELKENLASLLQGIEELKAANDLGIDNVPGSLISQEYVSTPPESLERFWGFSSESDPAQIIAEELFAMNHEPGTVIPFSKSGLDITGSRYLYVAFRSFIGNGLAAISLDGDAVTATVATRTLETATGHSGSFKIYASTTTFSGDDHLLEVVEGTPG